MAEKDGTNVFPPRFLCHLRRAVIAGMSREEVESIVGLVAMLWEMMDAYDADYLVDRCGQLVDCIREDPRFKLGLDEYGRKVARRS